MTTTDLAGAFIARARQHPDLLAVSARDQALTYHGLDERSDRVAAALVDRGVRSDSVVALFTGRTTAMVVGILGILKSGGAYLPIEPSHPAGRTRARCRPWRTR